MQEELAYDGSVTLEMMLEGIDVLEPLLPDFLGDERWRDTRFSKHRGVHAHHERVLVIGPVEDSDVAPGRQRVRSAPQEIMAEFLDGRLFERMNLTPLRIHT